MVDEGLALCATVHDAVLIEAPIDRINLDVEAAKSCWRRASEIVLDGFGLDADSKTVCYPDVYHDGDGEEMWTRLLNILDELERVHPLPISSAGSVPEGTGGRPPLQAVEEGTEP